ncbi:unnamed protein product, partial [Aphanomyces euteiches]
MHSFSHSVFGVFWMEGTPTRRYNTRSSQPPPLSSGTQSQATNGQVSSLYKMRAEILVKETVYGRDHNGKRLQPQVFEAESWEAMRLNVFQFALPNIASYASHVSDPRQ